EPLIGRIGDYQLQTNRPPNLGGVGMIEAQNLAEVSGLAAGKHWSKSGASLRKAVQISQMIFLNYLPEQTLKQLYPKLDFSSQSRTTRKHAEGLWKQMQDGTRPFNWEMQGPKHSDDVVAVDKEGNIAAITHSINCVDWGKTAIMVDGISIGDPGAF